MSEIKESGVLGIYTDRSRRLFTKSLVPGKAPFGERIFRERGEEYREFEPRRSKLAAALAKGCQNAGIKKGDIVLYLGASHGYTCSFVSDIVREEGLIFGIDPAPRVMRDLVFLSEERKNIVPILADANHPEEYQDKICAADIVYQDVAQRNQAEIFTKNCERFLRAGGTGLLAVKARSIDVRKKPRVIFEEVKRELEKKFKVVDFRSLEPFEHDHCMIIISYVK